MTMPRALDIAALLAVREALGLSDDVRGAMQILAAGNAFFGIVHEPGTTGPDQLDVLVEALGVQVASASTG